MTPVHHGHLLECPDLAFYDPRSRNSLFAFIVSRGPSSGRIRLDCVRHAVDRSVEFSHLITGTWCTLRLLEIQNERDSLFVTAVASRQWDGRILFHSEASDCELANSSLLHGTYAYLIPPRSLSKLTTFVSDRARGDANLCNTPVG